MRTRLRIIAYAAVGLVLAGVAFSIFFDKPRGKAEPLYNGEPLSELLEACRPAIGPWDTGGVAEHAVHCIGTNALPLLLEWITYELPRQRKMLLWLTTFRVPGKDLNEGKVVYGQSFILGKSTRLAELAQRGFVILNSNAIPAIPELERLMKDNRKPPVARRAIYALGDIGGPAITALTNALSNSKQSNRIDIIIALMGAERAAPYYYGPAYAGASLPALNRALKDPDAEVRRQASITLYNITEVTPQLLRAIHAP